MIYWDTSCLLKLYAPEADSEAWIRLATSEQEPLCSSELARPELCFALRRKELRREIRPGTADLLYDAFVDDVGKGRIFVVPLGGDVLDAARDLARACYARKEPILLRTLDGLHLASALIARTSGIVTTDALMERAARFLRLPLIRP